MSNETGQGHTPGPWMFKKFYDLPSDLTQEQLAAAGITPVPSLSNDGQRSITSGGAHVAYVSCQAFFKRGKGHLAECAERDANAALIAAAPELLDFLGRVTQLAVATSPRLATHAYIAEARAIIARAKGDAQ